MWTTTDIIAQISFQSLPFHSFIPNTSTHRYVYAAQKDRLTYNIRKHAKRAPLYVGKVHSDSYFSETKN